MKKQELFDALDGRFSKSRIKPTGGEPGNYLLQGRFGQIEMLDDGTWDVWVAAPDPAGEPLGSRKVSNILALLCGPLQATREWRGDGEASFTTTLDLILLNVDLISKALGIRKTRKMSPEARAAAAERLAEMRRSA